MKQYILAFLISLVSLDVLAFSQVSPPQSIKIDLKFNYEAHNKNGLGQQADSNTTLRMSANKGNEWQLVAGGRSCDSIDQLNAAPQGSASDFLLFAKVENINIDKSTIKFIVLDLKSGLGYIREPVVIAKYGQKAHLNVVDGDRHLHIDVLLNKYN